MKNHFTWILRSKCRCLHFIFIKVTIAFTHYPCIIIKQITFLPFICLPWESDGNKTIFVFIWQLWPEKIFKFRTIFGEKSNERDFFLLKRLWIRMQCSILINLSFSVSGVSKIKLNKIIARSKRGKNCLWRKWNAFNFLPCRLI